MKTKINNKLIRSFNACYDPSEIGIPDNESLSVKDWVDTYRNLVKNKQDVIWLLCRNEFLTDRQLRLFACWCAKEAMKLVKNPDPRSLKAIEVAEAFAEGNVTKEELAAAWAAAGDVAWAAARAAAWAAAWAAAGDVARAAAGDAQIDRLLIYFK